MIQVTRLNGSSFYINAELIQSVEGTPDTVITLLDRSKMIVRESPEEVVQRCLAYRRSIQAGLVSYSQKAGV